VNSVKPLFLLEELAIPHSVYVVDSPGKEAWFSHVNPCRMIPALEDFCDESKEDRVAVWESSSCLTFLADKYDHEHLFSGKDLRERAEVGNWMTLHTASLG
jgi:gliotoxin/aspirochlorine biosynthesis glutathione S-transferase